MTFQKTKNHQLQTRRGFTLIELLVAMSLFIGVVMIVGGSFVSVVSAYRRSMAIQLNVDNLNSSIESMIRGIKTGTAYHCGYTTVADAPNVRNCAAGGSYLAFESSSGSTSNASDQVVFCLGGTAGCGATAGQIYRSTDSGSNFLPLSSPPPSVTINSLKFFVPATTQPCVLVSLQGTTGVGASQTSFSVQTTVTQRVPNIP